MKQITDDYCSFEIAKLLKEKGFLQCKKEDGFRGFKYNIDGELTFAPYAEHYRVVTQSLALKWLREVHKIIISFNASFVNSIEPHFSWNIRINSLKSLNDEEHFEPIYINAKSESFEESCEEALLYVLKNLI